jgi:type II secretory pathway pseudopilin PulG
MNCAKCGGEAKFVAEYQQWWCDTCNAYVQVGAPHAMPGPHAPPGPGMMPGPYVAQPKQSLAWLWALLAVFGGLVVLGILAAVAIPSFMKYNKKSRTTEAREFVKKMYDGARSYYMDPDFQYGSIGSSVMAAQFPGPSVGPTPPLGTCCAQGGTCAPDRTLWDNDVWIALRFAVDDPHYYSYAYEVHGNARPGESAPIDGSNNFTVYAYGDLDCDGDYSTFAMYGEVNEVYSDGPAGNAALMRTDELE